MYDGDAGRPSLAMNNFVTKRGAPVPYTIYKIQQRIRQRRRRWEQAWDKQLVVWSIVLLVECGLNRGGQPL